MFEYVAEIKPASKGFGPVGDGFASADPYLIFVCSLLETSGNRVLIGLELKLHGHS